MKEQTLMTFDEWRAISAESRARINAYGLEMERLQAELATVEKYWEYSLSTSDGLARECISLKAERDAWKVEAMAAREFIGVLAKRLAELAHDEELEDESEKVFWRYMAARVKDGE